MQVINSRLVSNPWPSRRTKNKYNRQKPSNEMDPLNMDFFELTNRIPQTHGEKSIVERREIHSSYK